MKNSVALFLLLTAVVRLTFAQELPRRPYLGINLQGITDSLQRRYALPTKNGIFVQGVRAQSSALAAGLQANDIILQVGSTVLGPEVGPFVSLLKQYRTGDNATFTVLRNGKRLRKLVTLKPFPTEVSPWYETSYSSVQAGGNQLRTIITRPKGKQPQQVPMVLFIQGVGCFSVDNPLAQGDVTNRIIDSLSRHGYATMRVDKTGMGDSKGIPCSESDFRTEASGYKAGLAAIKQLPFVDQRNIFITGFSIGGIMAPVVAEGEPVRGVVVYGTASRSFIEYALQNKRNQSQLRQLPYDSINNLMRTYTAALHLLLTEKQAPAQVLARYPNAKQLISFPQHYSYIQQWQDVNLAAAWQKLNTHVLALRGEADYISYNEDHQLLVDVVNQQHPGWATFQLLPNVDHGFAKVKTQQESMRLADAPDPERNFEFMTVILRWLDSQRQV
ncbi:PDZ domain-containing protein [Hymenobacter tibetensis]|uniref:PDZ domain-containing protein n=1 Tax=Hymenobacter tibetensis TaxID=497967 RepID=A0ABY4D1Q3_9BACT|nr:alpha/beta fold hydrolase [Hymenobacter tibetensis]UOG76450.1 PDZ domain-containing protein [Hymenobacter tibetensis]